MSEGSSSKRKVSSRPETTEDSHEEFSSLLESQKGDVLNGTFKQLVEINDKLVISRDRRELAADKRRKLGIKNVYALHDYEMREIEAEYKETYQLTQDKLIAELKSEAQKMRKHLLRDDEELTSQVTGNAKVNSADRNNEIISSIKRNRYAEIDTFKLPLNEDVMRSDFQDILDDVEERASKYRESAPRPISSISRKATVVTKDAISHLLISKELFSVGNLIMVFSVISQETLSGVILTINEEGIILQNGSGANLSFQLDQINSGKVEIYKDADSEETISIMQKCSEILVQNQNAQVKKQA